MGITTHLSEEILEAFVMKRLQAEESEQLEDHLLICGTCRSRLDEVRQDVQAIRIAAARIREEDFFRATRKPRWQFAANWSFFRSGWMLAGAGLLTAVFLVPLFREPNPVYRDVVLQTMRGGREDTVVSSAGLRVRLKLALNGVAQLAQYQVVVVDSSGQTFYQSGPVTPETREQLTVPVKRELPPGVYWVRLSSPASGEVVLREYSLRIR